MAEKKPQVRKRERAIQLDTSADGFISVSRTCYGRSSEEMERINVPDLRTRLNGNEPALVRVGGGLTKNLGDYNSARVDVMIQLPCLPEISEVRRVADLISAQLDEMIPAELEKAMATE